jgi:hypothetical protein
MAPHEHLPGVNACLHWGHLTCSKSTRRSSDGAIACPQWGQGVESEAFTFSRLSFPRLGIGGFYRMGRVKTVTWFRLHARGAKAADTAPTKRALRHRLGQSSAGHESWYAGDWEQGVHDGDGNSSIRERKRAASTIRGIMRRRRPRYERSSRQLFSVCQN